MIKYKLIIKLTSYIILACGCVVIMAAVSINLTQSINYEKFVEEGEKIGAISAYDSSYYFNRDWALKNPCLAEKLMNVLPYEIFKDDGFCLLALPFYFKGSFLLLLLPLFCIVITVSNIRNYIYKYFLYATCLISFVALSFLLTKSAFIIFD